MVASVVVALVVVVVVVALPSCSMGAAEQAVQKIINKTKRVANNALLFIFNPPE